MNIKEYVEKRLKVHKDLLTQIIDQYGYDDPYVYSVKGRIAELKVIKEELE